LIKDHLVSDRMIPIANIVSYSEAVVAASLLRAHDIITHVGGAGHASAQVNSVALGGFRITVPELQHARASEILSETFARAPYSFSTGLQAAVIRFLLVYCGSLTAVVTIQIPAMTNFSWAMYLIVPASTLTIPVNPQGKAEYLLSGDGEL
jgi:hypothetical protein